MVFSSLIKAIAGASTTFAANKKGFIGFKKSIAFTYTPTDDVDQDIVPWNYSWRGDPSIHFDAKRILVLISYGERKINLSTNQPELTRNGRSQMIHCANYVYKMINKRESYPNLVKIYHPSCDSESARRFLSRYSDLLRADRDLDPNCVGFPDLVSVNQINDGIPSISTPLFPWDDIPNNQNLVEGRIKQWFKEFNSRDPGRAQTDVIICHENIVRYLILSILQMPADAWTRIKLRDAGVTVFYLWRDHHVSCKCINDCDYQPLDLQTERKVEEDSS